jgi:hypothetical protein
MAVAALFDNSGSGHPRRIAAGEGENSRVIDDAKTWRSLKETYDG